MKELTENAIDSGADKIQIIIKEAGKSLIQVIDNGCGMSETDARMSFERHATSKIKKADDLFAIRTMGFRGEALASIAAIAQVELKTKRIGDELGIQINITGLAEKILKNRRAEIEKAIDQAVHDELKLDKEVAKVWRDLQKPLRISKSPGEVWLMPKPFSVAVAPVEGNAHELIIPLRIAFRVGTHIGTEPTLDKLEPLPRLMRRERVTDQSSLHVLSFVAYSDINRILHKTIVEKKPGLPGGRLRIEDAEVMGGGTSLIMKTKIKGLMNGTLYFRGQPHYDTLTNTLRIQQVDYDVETKETLLETADWLLHDNLRDTLQSALVIPLQKGITELPGKIEQAFARGGAGKKTALDIDSFRLVPRKIVIRPDGVQVLIHVDSKVKIAVQRI